MSTRVPLDFTHPAHRKTNYKKNKKQMPRMDQSQSFFNIVNEKVRKAQTIHSSIQSRLDFLNNTDLNNKQNEVNRLYGIFQAGSRPHANDNRMKLSPSELCFSKTVQCHYKIPFALSSQS